MKSGAIIKTRMIEYRQNDRTIGNRQLGAGKIVG